MRVNKLFAPPIFVRDEEKTYRANLLNTSLWTVIFLSLLVMTGNLLGEKIPLLITLLDAALLVLCFPILFWMRKGHLKAASILLVVIGVTHLTIATAILGTVRTPTVMGYILAVVIAGLQFDKRGTILTTTSISLILLGLIYAEQKRLLPEPDFSVGITQWITYTTVLGFTGNLALLAVKAIKKSLENARQELEKRKQAEEALRIFSRAIEYNPNSIVITDAEGNIQNINPKFSELTGYSLPEAKGENPRILKSGEHPPEFYKNLWGTITSGQPWHGEFHNKKKDGELYWEKASIAPVFNEDNVITHYVAVKENITEQKLANEALKEANRQLQARLDQINELQANLREQTVRDPLTGLHNRRHFDEMLQKEFSRATRENYPFSLVMIDLDNLKEINDTGGHATGDHALRSLAGHLQSHIRAQDTVCRLGGDEFAIIMPNIISKDAVNRTQEMLSSIRNITLLHRADKTLRITFTAGISTYPTHGGTMEEVLNIADVALYRAKARGRNRVELFSLDDTITRR